MHHLIFIEEILMTHYAVEFSESGKYMAFVSFNASVVLKFQFPIYGERRNAYTTIEHIPYPKVMKPLL